MIKLSSSVESILNKKENKPVYAVDIVNSFTVSHTSYANGMLSNTKLKPAKNVHKQPEKNG